LVFILFYTFRVLVLSSCVLVFESYNLILFLVWKLKLDLFFNFCSCGFLCFWKFVVNIVLRFYCVQFLFSKQWSLFEFLINYIIYQTILHISCICDMGLRCRAYIINRGKIHVLKSNVEAFHHAIQNNWKFLTNPLWLINKIANIHVEFMIFNDRKILSMNSYD